VKAFGGHRVATLAGVAICTALTATSAPAAELRPVADAVRGWKPVRAQASWDAIDDRVRAGQAVRKDDRIKARAGRATTVVHLDEPDLPEGATPTDLKAHFYARTGRATRLEIELTAGGVPVSNGSLTAGTKAGWYEMDTTGVESFDLGDLKMEFTAFGKRRTQVQAAYADLITSGGEEPGEEPPSEEPPTEPGGQFPGEVSVFGSTTTIRPDQATPAGGEASAELIAAQNEFESFQVVVETTQGPIDGVSMEVAGALQGPGGERIDPANVTIYREAHYEVSAASGKPRSSRKGGEGMWPDALIPERDPYYGEDRAAFPVDVTASKKLVAWIDVFVPANAAPGAYSGELRVLDADGNVAKVPVSTQVSGVEMPSTSSLKSAFLATPPGYFPCRAHRATDWCHPEEESNWKLDYLYARAALENRMTIPNAMPGAYGQAPTSDYFDEYILPLINGTDAGGIDGTLPPRLQGAKMTTVTAMWQCIVDQACLGQWRQLAQEHGFGDRFFAYVCDEPVSGDTPEYWNDWGDCRRNARRAEQLWPGVKTMVTAHIQAAEEAEGAGAIDVDRDIDIMTVPVNRMHNRPDNPEAGDQTAAYSDFLSGEGKESWLYTACPQFSCDEQEAAYFDDWPAYVIDQPASQARAMGWISYLYGSDGELYHNTTLKLDSAWQDQYAFGGNGDGTLFYPGSPNGFGGAPAIGGQHDIPIESIRMKRIRDGREDYELLRSLGETDQAGAATSAVTFLLGSRRTAMYSTNVSQDAVDDFRCSLMVLADPSVGAACS
jgi:hypothetical protein